MRIISENEARTWLESIGVQEPYDVLYPHCDHWPIPPDSGRKAAIVKAILPWVLSDEETLIWIDEWGIWPSGENHALFAMFRRYCGETRPLASAPAHLLTRADWDFAESLLDLVLYFIWGTVIVDGGGQFVMRISHDEYFILWSKEGFRETAKDSLTKMTQ